MKQISLIALLAIVAAACSIRSNPISSGKAGSSSQASSLTEDQKHRLYTAALVASESPLGSDLFTDVCKKIGIYDADGTPNDSYMGFVASNVDWGMKPETEEFRREINTKEKAREYVTSHLPR